MAMQTENVPLEELRVADREHWAEGPPLEQFKRLRAQCPVHWSPGMSEFPDEPGFWSVTTQEDVHTVSRDWETYSSEIGGMLAMPAEFFPLEVQNGMFIGMDPPKHDRLKALFQRGLHPAAHRRARGRRSARSRAKSSTASRAARPSTSSTTSPSRSSPASSARSWASPPRTTRSGRA